MFTPSRLALATVLALAFTPLAAQVSSEIYNQDMAEGAAALRDGDYRTAIEKFSFWGMIQGDITAKLMLGAIAADGYGDLSNPDYAEALKWYRLAAEQNSVFGQQMVGEFYRDGKGVPQDPAQAVKWFRLAAEQGSVEAQDSLGVMFATGNGVSRNHTEALKWYRLAAAQGSAGAQLDLGIMYESGSGVAKDNVVSHMWYNIASTNGAENAAEWRDERAGIMTSADISKAQAMARECMNSNYKKCGY